MNKSYKGTGIKFGNVIFSRRFHPPLRSSSKTVEADFGHDTKTTRIFLSGLKKLGYNKDEKYTHDEIIRIFSHEVLHGVTEDIMTKDGLDYWSYNQHWPHENGMESDSSF